MALRKIPQLREPVRRHRRREEAVDFVWESSRRAAGYRLVLEGKGTE